MLSSLFRIHVRFPFTSSLRHFNVARVIPISRHSTNTSQLTPLLPNVTETLAHQLKQDVQPFRDIPEPEPSKRICLRTVKNAESKSKAFTYEMLEELVKDYVIQDTRLTHRGYVGWITFHKLQDAKAFRETPLSDLNGPPELTGTLMLRYSRFQSDTGVDPSPALLVSRVHPDATAEEVQAVFGKFGNVLSCTTSIRAPNSFEVTYSSILEATTALEALDAEPLSFGGRKLLVRYSIPTQVARRLGFRIHGLTHEQFRRHLKSFFLANFPAPQYNFVDIYIPMLRAVKTFQGMPTQFMKGYVTLETLEQAERLVGVYEKEGYQIYFFPVSPRQDPD